MPIYEYRCKKGHNFEVLQSMTDGPIATCEECDAPVERVFHPVAIHFKGSGFYSTDYGKGGEKKRADSGSGQEPSKSTSSNDKGSSSESKSGSGASSATKSSDDSKTKTAD